MQDARAGLEGPRAKVKKQWRLSRCKKRRSQYPREDRRSIIGQQNLSALLSPGDTAVSGVRGSRFRGHRYTSRSYCIPQRSRDCRPPQRDTTRYNGGPYIANLQLAKHTSSDTIRAKMSKMLKNAKYRCNLERINSDRDSRSKNRQMTRR